MQHSLLLEGSVIVIAAVVVFIPETTKLKGALA